MLQKCSIIKVAIVFFNEPTKQHYLKEISKKANIAHTSVITHLTELKKQKIIIETREKKGKRTFPFYTANIDSDDYKTYKKLINQIQLEESNLINFLKDTCMPKTIIVFGSYQKGEDTETSDIDIFLECKKKELQLNTYETKLKRKIQLHFKDNFKEYPGELQNNIINGTVLRGYLEAR